VGEGKRNHSGAEAGGMVIGGEYIKNSPSVRKSELSSDVSCLFHEKYNWLMFLMSKGLRYYCSKVCLNVDAPLILFAHEELEIIMVAWKEANKASLMAVDVDVENIRD
jgi:hypothetical protein